LAKHALAITRQLKQSKAIGLKKTGIWTKHYTMTLWENEADLKDFAGKEAHLEAMKFSSKLASEIRTLTVDAEKFPDWKTAKSMLKEAKVLTFQ
jgi:hypothetical protein